MKTWSICFAYLLFFCASMAQGESRRALEMAECGYLVGLAAEQLHARSDNSEDLDVVVGEITDFTNLYYHLSERQRTEDGTAISLTMYQTTMEVGRRVFDRRIVAMSAESANKLANRVMETCRDDLRLLGIKLRHG